MDKLQEQLQERLDELESRYAFAEDLLNSLNDTVAAQELRIGELERKLAQQSKQLRQLDGQLDGNQPEPPPPHY